MIEALDHLAIAVDALGPAALAYEALLGHAAAREAPQGGAERAWFHLPNISLELIAPAGDGPAGDRVRARLAETGEGLWLMAFAAEDLAATGRTLARRGVATAPAPGSASGALMADAASVGDLGMVFVPAAPPRAPSPVIGDPLASMAGLDHVVIQTPNPDRAAALYGARLGLDLRLDRTNPQWGNRLMFFRCGGLVIEIGHGLAGGVSDAPDRFGGLAWRAADPVAVQARLAGLGCNVSEVRPGRKPGTHIFTVRDGTCGVPTVVLSVEPHDRT
jgi:catechol 2,3-dioxygenase-like lactoylglutathione lyase family enzyme